MSPLSDIFCACSSVSRAGTSVSITRPEREPSVHVTASKLLQAETGPALQACYYEADPEDTIDTQFSLQLMSLEHMFASSLLVRRLGEGHYELDGRRVRLRWSEQDSRPELLVREEGLGASEGGIEPTLASYLRQAQDIAASLGGRRAGVPAVARVPADRRLTFQVAEATVMSDPNPDRIRSMKVACEQARLREEAAEAYESGEIAAVGGSGTWTPALPLGSGVLALPPVPPVQLPVGSGPPAPAMTAPPTGPRLMPVQTAPADSAAVRSASPPSVLMQVLPGPVPGDMPRLPSQMRVPSPPRTFFRSPTPQRGQKSSVGPSLVRSSSRVLPTTVLAAATAGAAGRTVSKTSPLPAVLPAPLMQAQVW